MPVFGLKWPLLVTLFVYLTLLVTRNTRLVYTDTTLASARNCCLDRQVDISDSRLSNFGSDSNPDLETSEVLAVDRIIPLTKILNQVMEKVRRKSALWIYLENKKILYLNDDILNLTFTEIHARGKSEKDVYGMDATVSKLDSLQRLGNAYIAENSDSVIAIVQKLKFSVMKYKFDYYDKDLHPLGSSSFIYEKNIFLLKITLSTNYDNTNCKLTSVTLTFAPDTKSCSLKIGGLFGTNDFYKKLKTVLYENFINKVSVAIIKEILPIVTKVVQQANMCSYFDTNTTRKQPDFSSFNKEYNYV